MHGRLIGVSKVSVVYEWVCECVCDCALRWIGTLSRVYPASCPMLPGIDSRFPVTLKRIKRYRRWMDGYMYIYLS